MPLLSRLAVQAAKAYGMLSSSDKNKVTASYLVVAGGGGGGGRRGGGGGAGGYQTSTFILSTLNTYAISVGAGGNGGDGSPSAASVGSNSVISGTGLTTITSNGGGGGGGGGDIAPSSGGSGGGGGRGAFSTGASGTTGQGNAGGNGDGSAGTGGGGGAGAVGGNGTTATSGNGGNGSASSISGSSVTYAGGGGGGGAASTPILGSAGNGGTGGGGNGSASGNGSNGTANLGGVGGTLTTSGGNQIHTFTSSGTLSPLTPVTASYLVVAGGGGGAWSGGGGGAGGLLTSSTTLYSGATYVVTVGAGGTNGTSGSNGSNGSDSSLNGTGLTTITSTGGGRGGNFSNANTGFNNGANGGSGGGGGSSDTGFTAGTGGNGTSGQGNAGAAGRSFSTTGASGGGGGAGGAGAQGTNGGAGGVGGVGVASSISGTSTFYAGGGAGGGTTSASGGNGGGGNSNGASTIGSSGTANTGGGGGAGGNTTGSNGAAGGSGIVIISYAGSQAFNGGLVTSSGGNTIHTFTSTGALTPLTNNLNNSLRFRGSASAYLNRTPTLTGNRQTFTYSFWTKLGGVISAGGDFISSNNAAGGGDAIALQSSSRIAIAGSGTNLLVTTQLLRDPSAWYHIVVAVDTTQATSANRIKLYINGNQVTAFNTASYPAQNYNFTYWNSSSYAQLIGGGYSYLDGYMTDINFIDGQALEPYYFGNNDANGVWKPILYKGTYGTNGFYLTFGNTTSTTTLGYDSSGNGNNWTCNNISLTAGVTYDAMTDVPTNTSATTANYATLNPILQNGWWAAVNRGTIQDGNLTFATGAGVSAFSNFDLVGNSGKWYYEMTCSATDTANAIVIAAQSRSTFEVGYYQNGNRQINSATPTAYGASWTSGDVIGVAIDVPNNNITFYKNNTSQGVINNAFPTGQPVYVGAYYNTSSGSYAFNFGQRPFAYTPPTGYVALNTYNLPTPTILQGNKYMDANLWSGNSSAQTVVNQAQFKPDFVWVKSRTNTQWNNLTDSVRGVTKLLYSNATNAEATNSTALTAFNSNGFSVGDDSGGNGVNTSGQNYVGWQWQAGAGTTSTNTSGSISSTVSVNTTAGFSIVTYTGVGSSPKTVGHGLGVAPKMIILKSRGAAVNWYVWHTSLGATQVIEGLNTTGAASTQPTFNSTLPTSSVISLGNNDSNNSGSTYVLYVWAEIAGFSKFGSYVGNTSADGPFVYCGFRPKYLLVKNTTSYDWHVFDAARNTYNFTNSSLKPDTSGAEYTNNDVSYDFLSNGFKVRGTDLALNANGNTMIFAAFAEHPFKNSNAR